MKISRVVICMLCQEPFRSFLCAVLNVPLAAFASLCFRSRRLDFFRFFLFQLGQRRKHPDLSCVGTNPKRFFKGRQKRPGEVQLPQCLFCRSHSGYSISWSNQEGVHVVKQNRGRNKKFDLEAGGS